MGSLPGTDNKNKIAPLAVENTLTHKLSYYIKSGILFYWASFFVLILIEFFLGGMLSKILTKENYSIYITVINTLPFYNILVNMGIAYGITYIVSYNSSIKFTLFRQTFHLHILWYILLVILHLAIFTFFNNYYFDALLITILISFAYSYKLNLTSFYLATGAYNKAAIANTLQKATLVFIIITIHYSEGLKILLNEKYLGLYPAIELSVVLLYFIFFWKTNYHALTAPKVNYRKRLLKFGKYAMFNNGLNVLYYSIIALIIRSSHIELHMQIMAGLCIMFFRYTVTAIAPVFSTMNPQLTRIKHKPAQVMVMYKKYFLAVLLVSLIIMLGCRFLFGFVITLFYATAYHDLPAYFNFFCYLIPLLFLNSLNGSVLAALGKIKFTTRAEVICTLILASFFIYNFVAPITDYTIINLIVLIHLIIKFIILAFGTYKTIKK